jgi:hypothetical protein
MHGGNDFIESRFHDERISLPEIFNARTNTALFERVPRVRDFVAAQCLGTR